MQERKEHVSKLLLVGDPSVGKSSLLLRFAEGRFDPDIQSTTGIDFRLKKVDFGDEVLPFQIWDTAGQDRYRAITTAFYRGAQGVIVVYDITSKQSFRNLRTWMRSLEQYAPQDVCKILVGNKSDKEKDREVDPQEARLFAESSDIKFFETSASTGAGVEDCFMYLARLIRDSASSKDGGPQRSNSKKGLVVMEEGPSPSERQNCNC